MCCWRFGAVARSGSLARSPYFPALLGISSATALKMQLARRIAAARPLASLSPFPLLSPPPPGRPGRGTPPPTPCDRGALIEPRRRSRVVERAGQGSPLGLCVCAPSAISSELAPAFTGSRSQDCVELRLSSAAVHSPPPPVVTVRCCEALDPLPSHHGRSSPRRQWSHGTRSPPSSRVATPPCAVLPL